MKITDNAVHQLIIDVQLIDPLSKIISKLQNGEFRDCDIKWLDNKLADFTQFAGKTLGLTLIKPEPTQHTILNTYITTQYINRFQTLLDYFKTF